LAAAAPLRDVISRPRAGQPTQGPEVLAWLLTEGTELPGDVTVLAVHREAVERTVEVLTDGPGGRLSFGADDPVAVVRLPD